MCVCVSHQGVGVRVQAVGGGAVLPVTDQEVVEVGAKGGGAYTLWRLSGLLTLLKHESQEGEQGVSARTHTHSIRKTRHAV